MSNSDFSSSGFVDNQQDSSIGVQWSDITPIPNNGHNALYRAKRYGRFFMLKTVGDYSRKDAKTLSQEVAVSNLSIYHDQLHKEFQIGVQLDHPNIAHTLYMEDIPDLGECIVMEYIDGEPWELSHAKTQRRENQKRLFLQLLDAVGYLHSKQIVHRDLKPANILVTRNGQNIKLIDFGLSDTDDYAILKQPAGTRKYIAPEQLAGEVLDIRADIYSLGVIMQEMLPHRYCRIAKKCTRQDKTKRYANCEAIAQAIRKADKRKVWLPIVLTISVLVILLSLSMVYITHQQKQQELLRSQYEQQIEEITAQQQKMLDGTEDRQVLEELIMGWWQTMEDRFASGEFKNYDEFSTIYSQEISQLWDTIYAMAKERYPHSSVLYNNFITIASDVFATMVAPHMIAMMENLTDK